MVALLLGCGLRRGEVLALELQSVQQREGHWVIADLLGKAGHVRTVPIPHWVKASLDAWTTAAGLTQGRAFRAINKAGRVWGEGMTAKVIWDVVKAAAKHAGIEKLAPHDLRRTCARLCHPLVANSTRFNSCWDMCRFRRQNDTWAASRSSGARSTTPWGLSPNHQREQGHRKGRTATGSSAPSRL
jgi:hypothetical protein